MIVFDYKLSSHWLHLYKQALATFASCLLCLTIGITIGNSAVLLPQLEGDPSFPYDKSFDSWIASISPFAMIFGSLCSGPISDVIGRKLTHVMLSFPLLIGWAIMGFAANNTIILLGRFIIGLCTGAVRPASLAYIGEITDPKYRAIMLFCPTLAMHTGVLISHIIGNYVYWKTSCFIFGLPNLVSFIMFLFLKESPLWLISKGKIEQGVEVFQQFRGEEETAVKELVAALQKQSEQKIERNMKKILNVVFSIAFFKSLTTVFLLFVVVQLCGLNTLSFYGIYIFKSTFSGDVDPFTFMVGMDCIKVMGATIVCVLGKKLPRKLSFLLCSFTLAIVLLFIVVYLYIQPVGFIWVAVTCMVTYMAIGSAVICLAWSFVAEIFPSTVRGLGSGLSSFISYALLFFSVKITPGLMASFGLTVLFAGFALITFVASVFLCFILPETNGKSLQDIEDILYKKNNIKTTNVKSVSQTISA